jgi:hypothetical protein
MRRSFSRGDGTGKGAGPASPLPPTRAPVEALSDKTAAESPADQATNLRLRRRWPPWCPPEREEPCPPPCPPRDPCPPREPHRPGRSCQDVDLAEAFVPWQEYNGYCPPGHLEGPGTIFPELLRTPPLYAWPPGTDRRRG